MRIGLNPEIIVFIVLNDLNAITHICMMWEFFVLILLDNIGANSEYSQYHLLWWNIEGRGSYYELYFKGLFMFRALRTFKNIFF